MASEAAAHHINIVGDACLRILQWLLHDSGAGGTRQPSMAEFIVCSFQLAILDGTLLNPVGRCGV